VRRESENLWTFTDSCAESACFYRLRSRIEQ
jgi:hypothetical protein